MSGSYGSYAFGEFVNAYDTNFAQGVAQTRRMPGVDGGWSDLGFGPAETPPGRLSIEFWLVAEAREDMDALRDEARALMSYGLQRLEYTSLDANIGTRYCYARALDVTPREMKAKHTDLFQRITAIFEVPEARWYKDRYNAVKVGDGTALDDGATVGSGALLVACSGLVTEFAALNGGNAITIPAISVMPGSGQSCENPKVQRIEAGLIADEIAYTGVIAAESELFCDGKREYAALDADNVFGPNFSYINPSLFRLQPGPNVIRVVFANSGDAAGVRLWYRDCFR